MASGPDPRDAEIARLRARVAEVEALLAETRLELVAQVNRRGAARAAKGLIMPPIPKTVAAIDARIKLLRFGQLEAAGQCNAVNRRNAPKRMAKEIEVLEKAKARKTAKG